MDRACSVDSAAVPRLCRVVVGGLSRFFCHRVVVRAVNRWMAPLTSLLHPRVDCCCCFPMMILVVVVVVVVVAWVCWWWLPSHDCCGCLVDPAASWSSTSWSRTPCVAVFVLDLLQTSLGRRLFLLVVASLGCCGYGCSLPRLVAVAVVVR